LTTTTTTTIMWWVSLNFPLGADNNIRSSIIAIAISCPYVETTQIQTPPPFILNIYIINGLNGNSCFVSQRLGRWRRLVNHKIPFHFVLYILLCASKVYSMCGLPSTSPPRSTWTDPEKNRPGFRPAFLFSYIFYFQTLILRRRLE
jgi:hypothetical protein